MTLVLYMYGAAFDLINTKNGTMERGHIPNFDGTCAFKLFFTTISLCLTLGML